MNQQDMSYKWRLSLILHSAIQTNELNTSTVNSKDNVGKNMRQGQGTALGRLSVGKCRLGGMPVVWRLLLRYGQKERQGAET
jgi:hypothetical protein